MSRKHTKKMKRLLERMADIEGMERGNLCQMSGRPQYNHQTWRDGKNEVRHVRKAEVAKLRKDISGISYSPSWPSNTRKKSAE